VPDHQRQPPLTLSPRLSRRLAAFVALTHAGAAACVLALPVSWPWRVAGLAAIALSGLWQGLTHLWPRAPWAVRQALLGEDGWELTLGSGRRVQARLAPSTYVGARLVVLNFRGPPWRRCSMVLPPDALDPDLLRRLRVRLRLGVAGR
jgi:toxin CptA